MLGRDFEDEIWSIFVLELVIWPKHVTLVSWTQPSGPMCLCQCVWYCLKIWWPPIAFIGVNIEYPNTNIFRLHIDILRVDKHIFRQDIDILRQANGILKSDIIVIRRQNIDIWPQLRSHVWVSRKYILKFWFTISFSQITKYHFDSRFDFLTRFELSAKSAFTRLKSQGNDKEVGGSGVENENVRFLKISEVWKYKCQMF